MCPVATLVLNCEPATVSQGRKFVFQHISRWCTPAASQFAGLLDDILLATSELLTNAVTFCKGEDITLVVAEKHGEVTIKVIDASKVEARAHSASLLDESGRGLSLVEAVAEQWGQERHLRGKAVWCIFRFPSPSD